MDWLPLRLIHSRGLHELDLAADHLRGDLSGANVSADLVQLDITAATFVEVREVAELIDVIFDPLIFGVPLGVLDEPNFVIASLFEAIEEYRSTNRIGAAVADYIYLAIRAKDAPDLRDDFAASTGLLQLLNDLLLLHL